VRGPYVEIPAAALEEHVQAFQREDRADGWSMLTGVLRAVRVDPELVHSGAATNLGLPGQSVTGNWTRQPGHFRSSFTRRSHHAPTLPAPDLIGWGRFCSR
jgi:hypothetical protein